MQRLLPEFLPALRQGQPPPASYRGKGCQRERDAWPSISSRSGGLCHLQKTAQGIVAMAVMPSSVRTARLR
jgi:hypothetical protein